MKMTVIHGQSHKGVTYTMTHSLLERLACQEDEIREFFLPADGPDFCVGCNSCFMKGEEHCPSAAKVQPIAMALEWADVIILDSPNYVMEMSGAMKNLMDHLAYRWVTHRPHGSMFLKVGIAVCSSAGAPAGGTAKSMARQLKWMGCSKTYLFTLTSNALSVSDLKPKKRIRIERRSAKIACAVKRRVANPRPSLRGKATFAIFRKMQSTPASAWNPTDRNWWRDHGWTGKVRPWKN